MRLDPNELPPSLRLGAVLWPEAGPLVEGFDTQSHVRLVRGEPEALLAALKAGDLDAALLPPLAAWQVERVRLVPGLALAARPPATTSDPSGSSDLSDRFNATPSTPPQVLLVWACRPRAPFPEIRRTLVSAWRTAVMNLQAGGDYSYRLGGDESDSLRAMLALAQARGEVDAAQEVVYC